MATTTLRPNAVVTAGSWVSAGDGVGVTLSAADVSDDPDSPVDTSYAFGPADAAVGACVFALDMPVSDIGTVTAIQVRLRYRTSAAADDSHTLVTSITDASGTVWAAGSTLALIEDGTWYTVNMSMAASGTGTQDQARWNDARVNITHGYTRSMGADGARIEVSAVEVNLTYTAAAAPITRSPSDNLGITDSITVLKSLAPSDNIGLTDSASRATTTARSPADPVGLTDSASRATTTARSLTDAVGLTDSITVEVGAGTAHTRTVPNTPVQVAVLA